MKKIIPLTLSFIFFVQITLIAQRIPSSCEMEGEIAEYLSQNAACLTIKWLKAIKSSDTALIEIPEEEWDYIRGGVYAVYNAESIFGYDSIRTCSTRDPNLSNYVILVDTNSLWVNAWKEGDLITGDQEIDQFTEYLEFEIVELVTSEEYGGVFVEFYTDKIFNSYAVCDSLLRYSEISMAYTYDHNALAPTRLINYYFEDGIRKLTYSYGWGDCIAGCAYWKHWNVNVYKDCSVELVGHNPPIYTGITDIITVSGFLTYPNPFSTSTTIEYTLDYHSDITLTIFNHLGKQVELIRQHQQPGKQQITWNADGLPAGIYFYTLKVGDQAATGKLIKM